MPPADTVVAGGPLHLILMITNDTNQAMDVTIPPRLDLRITTDSDAFNIAVEADPQPGPAAIRLAPQTFRKVRYAGQLPDKVLGPTTVRARELETNSLVIAVQRASPPEKQAVIADRQQPATLSTPASRFLSALSTYEPVYVAVGTRVRTNAKFQLSFKYRFFSEEGPLVQRVNFLQDLYFGYTQTALWDLESNSAPFYDSSYKPRLFYLNDSVWDWPAARLGLGMEGGLGHESNGKSGTDSRSMNIAYIKPIFTLGDRRGWHWTVSPMLIDYLEKDDNPDIDDYRGHVDLQLTFGKEDSFQLAGQFRRGSQGFSAQLDLTYPLSVVALGNLNGYFLVQYFTGYGESLLDYNRRTPAQLRLGLMIVR